MSVRRGGGVRWTLTPSVRRKIEALALWVAEGRARDVAPARRAVVALLREAAAERTLTSKP
jgi:hypothetical protein